MSVGSIIFVNIVLAVCMLVRDDMSEKAAFGSLANCVYSAFL